MSEPVAVHHDEYLILSWDHGGTLLDTAVRPDRHQDLEELGTAGVALLPQGASS